MEQSSCVCLTVCILSHMAILFVGFLTDLTNASQCIQCKRGCLMVMHYKLQFVCHVKYFPFLGFHSLCALSINTKRVKGKYKGSILAIEILTEGVFSAFISGVEYSRNDYDIKICPCLGYR